MGWGWELHGCAVLMLTGLYLMGNSPKIKQKEIIGKLMIFHLSRSYSIAALLTLRKRGGEKSEEKLIFLILRIVIKP